MRLTEHLSTSHFTSLSVSKKLQRCQSKNQGLKEMNSLALCSDSTYLERPSFPSIPCMQGQPTEWTKT
ncbi:hypothetical protein NP493_401g02027 [Ridgeia piscesae]|uniref:Uncharacterized protein n=1 Tax=Ridgeia piscesae TaxID=27915 RepID=A0AAD9NUQ5_RIDPI|nr:hypothetical protein NP493_401g02027 [Ridgeia piscesae]